MGPWGQASREERIERQSGEEVEEEEEEDMVWGLGLV
jgi:hypothetical protein